MNNKLVVSVNPKGGMSLEQLLQAAFLAGRGCRTEEIARELRILPSDLRRIMTAFGVQMDLKQGGMERFEVWLSGPRAADHRRAAKLMNYEPNTLLEEVSRQVAKFDLYQSILRAR